VASYCEQGDEPSCSIKQWISQAPERVSSILEGLLHADTELVTVQTKVCAIRRVV
jgi:hypothetical protein